MLIWSILNVQIYLTIQILQREVHVKITTAIKLSLSITPHTPLLISGSVHVAQSFVFYDLLCVLIAFFCHDVVSLFSTLNIFRLSFTIRFTEVQIKDFRKRLAPSFFNTYFLLN